MTGRSLHDALLRALRDWSLREHIMRTADEPTSDADQEAEWQIVRRIPARELSNMARFLARHYYTERIVRLFRHIHRLSAWTGRDPRVVLNSQQGNAVLDHAVVGSLETAEAIAGLIEHYLLEDDATIRAQFPYWRDLVHYHGAMFRLEARREAVIATHFPCRSPSAEIKQFEWDLPAIIAALRKFDQPNIKNMNTPCLLLIAASANQHVTTLRCLPQLQLLFLAADGMRTVEELSSKARLSLSDTQTALQQMKAVGAIMWEELR